ncbi:MAG: transglutaminase-like cysteine peptidase [Rhodospirillaceae bacterium]|nr:transglutaminase-like cysteine peptidase [Rhodospirillaceae bacterium]MDD9928103.1 transglutaminase-like cysteine peptidase [Rhodospirillaceae bacterium]
MTMLKPFKCSRTAFIIALLVGFTIAWNEPTLGATQKSGGYPKLFGSREFKSSKLTKFRKWTDVIQRYENSAGKQRRKCRVSRVNRCPNQQWDKFLKEIESLPRRDQIDQVNSYFNRLQYIVDPVNYGKKDYWATPVQFFNKNGDCEDYAISKYLSLRKLGVPVKDMRIVVLRDLNLKVAHAVLVVYYKGAPLILDNQISQVINADRIRHYQPIYSINENNWWLHRS